MHPSKYDNIVWKSHKEIAVDNAYFIKNISNAPLEISFKQFTLKFHSNFDKNAKNLINLNNIVLSKS